MSYQMSRVRGADEYLLTVTRATTIGAVCQWVGVERSELLKANPNLSGDPLVEGQQLNVPAQLLDQASNTREDSTQPDQQLAPVEDGSLHNDDAPLRATPLTDILFGAIGSTDPSEESNDTASETEQQEAQDEPEVPKSGDDAAEPVKAAVVTETPKPTKTVTWQPFPKTNL